MPPPHPSTSLIVDRPNQTPELSSWFRWITISTFLIKKDKNIESNREKPNQQCLYFVLCSLLLNIVFVSFFNLWLSPYISIYHYIFVLFVYLVLYMNPVDKFFFPSVFFLWRAFLRRYSEGKKVIRNWLGLPEQMLSQGCFWPSWLTVDVNDNQPRGLLLFCSDSIHLCYQGIGIIQFFSVCHFRK